MTTDELIVKQQLEIEELKIENNDLRMSIAKAHGYIICIGGPLNDDRLGFNKEQRMLFHRISNALNGQ